MSNDKVKVVKRCWRVKHARSAMKLKQRVIVTGSLFLTMVLLFTIGMHLSWPEATERDKQQPRSSSPDNQPQIKQPHFDVHTPNSNGSKKPSFVPPSPPLHLPHLPPGLNLSDLGLGPRPGGGVGGWPPQPGPRRMLQDPLNLKLPQGGGVRGNGRVDQLSVPAEIAELNPWAIWRGWVEENTLYPNEAFYSDEMNHILATMATADIISFGLGSRGTQLKATAMLGSQKTVFKPKRYSRDAVIAGDPYAGFDRHTGEIAGFHLDGILGFRIAPPVVGRRLNLTQLKPVTTTGLQATYLTKDGNLCFYGKCYYCKPSEAACAEGDVMEGSLTLWLPDWYKLTTKRHPYQRTYRDGVKARWEMDHTYCQRQLLKPSSEYYYGILEFTDTAIFDFLMGNADRHHYETYSNAQHHGKLMHIDNGKTFGNPDHDEMSILAPLTQCCRFRSSTWQRLAELSVERESLSELLDRSMRRDPLWPILTPAHLKAIDRRLATIINAVHKCIEQHGRDTVIVDNWP